MSDPHDVSTHFSELKRQLQADGFDSSTPIGEVLTKLHSSLLEDGFDLASTEETTTEEVEEIGTAESTEADEEVETVKEEQALGSETNLLLKLKDAFVSGRAQNTVTSDLVLPPVTLQAFRTFSALDADLLKDFLLSQWCHARVFAHKDKYFVVASNVEVTDADVKKALQNYVSQTKV